MIDSESFPVIIAEPKTIQIFNTLYNQNINPIASLIAPSDLLQLTDEVAEFASFNDFQIQNLTFYQYVNRVKSIDNLPKTADQFEELENILVKRIIYRMSAGVIFSQHTTIYLEDFMDISVYQISQSIHRLRKITHIRSLEFSDIRVTYLEDDQQTEIQLNITLI